MHFLPNYYFKAKNIIKADIDYSAEKNKGLLNESIIARLYDDIVDSKINDEDIIISEILFQDAVINKIGNTTDIISLTRAITQFDNGYKFTVLNDEEYEDLKSIVEKLKGYLAEHSK